jgi:hypothetical protein
LSDLSPLQLALTAATNLKRSRHWWHQFIGCFGVHFS